MEEEFEATSQKFTGVVPTDVIDIGSLGEKLVLVKNTKVNFTHDLAQRILTYQAVPWERELRNNHVSFLIREMMKDTFLAELATLATCACEEDGKEYRVNGQHTCWARLEITEEEYSAKPISVLKYKATTIADLRRLYASFDRGTPRTRSNIIQAYLGDTEQFKGVTSTLVRALASAVSFWLWEKTKDRAEHGADDVAYLMQRDHADLINKVVLYMEEKPVFCNEPWLRRSPVVAAVLETFSKAQKPSEEFWNSIKIGVGFETGDDPRLRLRNMLMNSVINSSMNVSGKKRTDQESIYRWCITAWNAWRAGDKVKLIRTSNKRQRAK